MRWRICDSRKSNLLSLVIARLACKPCIANASRGNLFIFLDSSFKNGNFGVDCFGESEIHLAMTKYFILPTPLIPLRKGGGKRGVTTHKGGGIFVLYLR